MSAELYQESILDHYRNPRNKQIIPGARSARDVNALCGDEITFMLKFSGGKVSRACFDGKGCAISQAAASILTEMLVGKTADDVVKLDKKEMLDALGIPLTGMRLKCGLLPLKVAKLAAMSQE